jgi:hypothetical protein
MNLLLIIVVLILLFGGAGGYWGGWASSYPYGGHLGYGGSLIGLIVVILVIAFLLGVI